MFIVRLSLQLAGLCDNDALLCQTHELCSQFRSPRTDSEVALAPVWYRPGFLMDVFGLGVNQITGMSSAVLRTKVGTSEPRRFTAISKHHFVLVCVVKASACKSACV